MIEADDYLNDLEARLVADGCQVTHERPGLVAYKAQTRLLMRAHVFGGVRVWGFALNAMIKKTLTRYLPDPRSAR